MSLPQRAPLTLLPSVTDSILDILPGLNARTSIGLQTLLITASAYVYAVFYTAALFFPIVHRLIFVLLTTEKYSQSLCSQLMSFIKLQPEHYSYPSIFIYGHRASGKSHVMQVLLKELQVRPHALLCFFLSTCKYQKLILIRFTVCDPKFFTVNNDIITTTAVKIFQ